MFPWVYGFAWNFGNIIFLGAFFSVLAVVLGTIMTAGWRAVRDRKDRLEGRIRWHGDFHDLPSSARTCRHVFTGEFRWRQCEREFDCRACPDHHNLQQREGSTRSSAVLQGGYVDVLGLYFPLHRFYHRGHTWIEQAEDQCVMIGLDEFARRVVGPVSALQLPARGSRLTVGDTAWKMKDDRGTEFRVLAPVDGVVLGSSMKSDGWMLRMMPDAPLAAMAHLLRGAEVQPWIVSESERLQSILARQTGDGIGVTLADGGTLADDLPAMNPGLDWTSIRRELLLEG